MSDVSKPASDRVRNINTLAIEVEQDFANLVEFQQRIDQGASRAYIDGFRAGVNALQMRFLRAMEKGELDYKKVNRD